MQCGIRTILTLLTVGAAHLACAAVPAATATTASPSSAAAAALRDFDRVCAAEGGDLWGVSLCGPMLVVDPESRAVTANAGDLDGLLVPSGDLFTGRLPADVALANTAVTWSGTRWSMVLMPLPDEVRARRALMLHEAWHRIQGGLGLPARDGDNGHLEDPRARTWLRLEWRALARALSAHGAERRVALADAIVFRRHRRELFPGAAREEDRLELNEGLAEYTGERIAYGDDAAATVVHELAAADRRKHLVRSFAYLSGPAYGVLLDQLRPGWRRGLTPTADLGALAAEALSDVTLDPATAETRAEAYGYSEVARQERQLGVARARRAAELRAALVDAPALVLPLTSVKMQFNPHRVVGLAPDGTVYLQLEAEDAWGRVKATAGSLIAPGFTELRLPGRIVEVREGVVVGDSWRLELAKGWRLITPAGGPATVAPER